MTQHRSPWIPVMLCATLAVAAPAFSSPAQAAPAERLEAERYRRPTPGSDIDTGGAKLLVHAPIEVVRRVIQDYRNYHKYFPRMTQSRIVNKKRGETDVYMRIPIFGGLAAFWGLSRFSPPKKVGRGEVIVGRYVKGNLNHWFNIWRLYPCSEEKTYVRMEMYADVKFFFPADMVTGELEWACDEAVTAVRARAECIWAKRRRRGAVAAPLKPAPAKPPAPPSSPSQPDMVAPPAAPSGPKAPTAPPERQAPSPGS